MASLNGGIIGVDNPVQQQAEQITTFTATGTLTTQPLTSQVQYVIVAGGASGSGGVGGGGGAGGYRSSVPGENSGGGASAESLHPVSGNSPYPIVIGAGGTRGASETTQGTNGSNSSFDTITCIGGGTGQGFAPNGTAQPGGSGGGGNTTSGTPGQGYGGHPGVNVGPNLFYRNGGGGGASAAGDCDTPASPPAPPFIGGPGGDGVTTAITGTPQTLAGGGGGGWYLARTGNIPGTGGAGGGGPSNTTDGGPSPDGYGHAGTANTGGGGGGGSGNNGLGGNGGSGKVIIKEPAVVNASGMWSMEAVYDNVKAGNWTNA